MGMEIFSDLALINGNIITVDKDFSKAEAVAIKDNKILAVGANEEIKELINGKTEVLDLKGKTALPGINDAHIHPALYGAGKPPLAIDLRYPAVKSIQDIVRLVEEKAKTAEPGEWIRGVGWNESLMEECQQDPERLPTRWDLDPVSKDNPVLLESGWNAWVNSKTLELAGITKDSELPDDGEIWRDPKSGDLTGIFKGMAPKVMIMKNTPKWTFDQKKDALVSAMKYLNAMGITSITDSALGPGNSGFEGGIVDSETLSAYIDLYNEGQLTVRSNLLLVFGDKGFSNFKGMKDGIPFLGLRTGLGDNWLRIAGIKMLADGTTLGKGSWMKEAYVGGGHGRLVVPGNTEEEQVNELMNMLDCAHRNRFQIGLHVIGDRAIEACVDGIIKAMENDPWEDPRHYIMHANFISDEYAKKLADYGIGANVQTQQKSTRSDILDKIMGKERSARDIPLRSLIDAGVHVTNSSDAPGAPDNWKEAIQAAVLRESTATGKVSGPEQCITREESIRMYTIEGAYQHHQENIKGSIEPGKLADICILDEDILSVEAHRIKDIETLMTIVDGKIVYGDGSI